MNTAITDSSVKEELLTTIDNPYSPFDDFDNWFAFDESHGYHTCSYLARIAKTSDDLSDASQDEAFNAAVNEILSYNISGKHIKVTEDYYLKEHDTV